jgi:UrcA family protein
MIKTLVSVALAAAAVSAAPAAAQMKYDKNVREQVVSYADLNLGSAAGRSTLDRRIRTAARSVCGMPLSGLPEVREVQACRVAAMGAAKAEVEQVLAGLGSTGPVVVARR